jgi:nucleoside 2-deoxyribosyltransferase
MRKDSKKQQASRKPYKFYIAGSFPRKDALKAYAEELVLHGHECTSRWLVTAHEADVSKEDELSPSGPGYVFAQEDIEDIDRADAMIFFSSSQDGQKFGNGRGGRHTEFGYALGTNVPIFLIGDRENAFHSRVPDHRKFYDFRSFVIGLDFVVADLDASAFRAQ